MLKKSSRPIFCPWAFSKSSIDKFETAHWVGFRALKKMVTSNLKWFTKNNIISKNVQVKYGSDFLRKKMKMENGFENAV